MIDFSTLRLGASNPSDDPAHPEYTGPLPGTWVKRVADRITADPTLAASYPEAARTVGPGEADPGHGGWKGIR